MNEKKYEKKYELQNKVISRQSEQIATLKAQIKKLELKLEEKEQIINSTSFLRDELIQNVDEVKKYKKEYEKLISELRKMKEIINQDVYKGKWKLVKFLIK